MLRNQLLSGGVDNLNAGTRVGNWYAKALDASSVYFNNHANRVLYAGTGAFDLTARFENEAVISDGIGVSLDFALVRLGGTASRRNSITGLDSSGNVVFRVILSGYSKDNGSRTLYLENSSGSMQLLASGLARAADSNFRKGSLDSLTIGIDRSGISVSLNGKELARGIAFYSSRVSGMTSLKFAGDSCFFDNIRVDSTAPSRH